MSCKKAQEVLGDKSVDVQTVVDGRKEKLNAEDSWKMVQSAKRITAARGKKVVIFDPKKDDKDTILKSIIGPSGNLRAPAFRIKDEYIIGFNPELYEKTL